MTQKAVIYARFSTLEQAKGYSLERQFTYGKKFVENQGWILSDQIADEGRSAFHGANRVEGAALHKFEMEAEQGLHRGTVLVVENLDRLSRQGVKEATKLIWALNDAGVTVATWHDKRQYVPNSRDALLDYITGALIAARSQEESETKRDRANTLWTTRYKAIAEGDKTPMEGNYPAWIEIVDGKYKLIDRRVKVLNEIFDLYISGVGIYKIVQMLNDREEPMWQLYTKPTGGGWYLAYIHRLLTKRAVMGEYVTLKGEVISTDHFPQAISADKFNRAQALLATKRVASGQGSKRLNNLLSGIVVCETCGGTAGYENKGSNSTTKYVNKKGETVHYKRKTYERYRCDRNRRKRACTNDAIFDYKVIESTVLNELLPDLVEREEADDAARKLREDIAELERQIEGDRVRLENLIDVIADGGSKSLVERVKVLEAQIDEREAEQDRAKEALAFRLSQPSDADDVALIEQLRDQLTSEDDDQRVYARGKVNLGLRRLLHKIELAPENTFTIWRDEYSWWRFNEEGKMLEGQYTP